nr:MAG TPA: hypothetical protein [Caudoviricetes sp.]
MITYNQVNKEVTTLQTTLLAILKNKLLTITIKCDIVITTNKQALDRS